MKITTVFLLCAITAGPIAGAVAQTFNPEQAREIVHAHEESVLPFRAAISYSASAGGRTAPARDQVIRASGVVLTGDGLIATALSVLEPSSLLNGQKLSGAGGAEYSVSTEIKELSIIMNDGLEIPAIVVLKDADLDLVFFRPKPGDEDAKDAKFHPLDLADSAPADLLDRCVILNRLSKSYGYQIAATVSVVNCKVEKPRLLYRIAGATPGTPVFTAQGKLLGMALIRKIQGDDSAENRLNNLAELLVVVPAEEIARVAEQAKKAVIPAENAADSKPASPAPTAPAAKSEAAADSSAASPKANP